jgi:hypothetical protein
MILMFFRVLYGLLRSEKMMCIELKMVNFDFKTNASLPATGKDANAYFVKRWVTG